MKLVKEHIILEKFVEESDPIKDLNIGGMKVKIVIRFNFDQNKEQDNFVKKFNLKKSSSNYQENVVSIYQLPEMLKYLHDICKFDLKRMLS